MNNFECEEGGYVVKKVTCSNTLSKDFKIETIADIDNIRDDFTSQAFSAKEALDLAVKKAKQAQKFAELISNRYPNVAKRICKGFQILERVCSGWNEDEMEVVL